MHCNIFHAYHNLIRLDKYGYMFCNATCTCVLNIIWSCDFHYEESFLVCIVNTIVSCVDDTFFDTICHMLIVCQYIRHCLHCISDHYLYRRYVFSVFLVTFELGVLSSSHTKNSTSIYRVCRDSVMYSLWRLLL